MQKSVLLRKHSLVPFNAYIGPLSGATTLGQNGPGSDGNKGGTPHSPKLQHYWNLTIRLFGVIFRILIGGRSYLSAEKQSVYSTAPADWARFEF